MDYIPAKTIITRTKASEWFGTDYNMNIYRGCSHGCIYCDSRSLCYQIEDFDKIRAKENVLEIIKSELSKKIKKGVIASGAMSDPYNPYEKELKLTEGALELLNEYRFGSSIATKSSLIERDINILKEIQSHSPVIIKMTITTADDDKSSKIEPQASLPSERFEALKKLSENGIYCGILMMPLLPFINDTKENIIELIKKAGDNGVRFIYPSFGMTLRIGNREYFYSKLEQLFPGLKQKYIARFGNQYYCGSPNKKRLFEIFEEECSKYGIIYKMKEIIKGYREKYCVRQLSLF
ncbi:MAG: radical SAM protein [Spirochaetaceae bacterium]|nr:radical SAM protein [Spirochaetaceae bacterium]